MIERFLAFDWDDTTTQDKGISPNDELKTSLVNSDVSTLLPSIFNETNPFLNDILQSWNLQGNLNNYLEFKIINLFIFR